MADWLGVDFGTSNTSAAAMIGGRPTLIELEPGQTAIPTAVFLDFAAREMLLGAPAVAALVEGRDGRFLRALKRVLGKPLLREPRQLLNRRMTLLELVAMILREVKTRTEQETGRTFTHVVAGRPVRFHDKAEEDVQAAVDLAEAYALAGFDGLDWLPEPEAAALACGISDGLGLVVDIGGGTSDFTLFRATGGEIEIQASAGVRVGGTDADRALSLARVMPLLGLGGTLRAEIGTARHPAPIAPFLDLATWEKIGFLQTPEMHRAATRMARLADDPVPFQRLEAVMEHMLGFDLAFAVEAGKIAANEGAGKIDLSEVEPNLSVPVTAEELAAILSEVADAVEAAARNLLEQTGTLPDTVTHVVFVGGSALLGAIRARMTALCPKAAPVETEAFTAVASGLAIAAGRNGASDSGLSRTAR
jgi:hypothetical chaperone protein